MAGTWMMEKGWQAELRCHLVKRSQIQGQQVCSLGMACILLWLQETACGHVLPSGYSIMAHLPVMGPPVFALKALREAPLLMSLQYFNTFLF